MRIALFAAAAACLAGIPAIAQERHAFVQKVVEYRAGARVFADSVSGWSANPQFALALEGTLRLMGLEHQLERVTGAEISEQAAELIRTYSGVSKADMCDRLTGLTMANPFKADETIALFVRNAN